MSFLKIKEIPIVITLIAGVTMIAAYFVEVPSLVAFSKSMNTYILTIAAFALFIGIINVIRTNTLHLLRRTPGRWYLSGWLLFLMFLVSGIGVGFGPKHPVYLFINNNLYVPLSAAVMALTAFFITSAAYRAFRVRSLESVLFFIAAVIVMLGNTGIGDLIPGVPASMVWLIDVPTMSANRGMIIAIGIGGVLMGLRTLVGLEKGAITEE